MRIFAFFLLGFTLILTGCGDAAHTEQEEIQVHQQKCIECLQIQNKLLEAELTLKETYTFHFTSKGVRDTADRGIKQAAEGNRMCSAVADHPGVEDLKNKFYEVYEKLKSRKATYSK